MNRLTAVALTVTLSVAGVALAAEPTPEMSKSVVAEAQTMADAMLQGNIEIIVDRMHPDVRDAMGGRDTAIGMVRSGIDQMSQQGMKITGYEVSPPVKMFKGEAETVLFLPTRMVIEGPAKLESIGFLIASRPHEGGDWRFLDGAGIRDPAGLSQLFPGLPVDITLPERRQGLVEE